MRFFLYLAVLATSVQAYSTESTPSRRAFLQKAPTAFVAAAAAATQLGSPALAAPEIKTTSNGKIKYAVTQPAKDNTAPIKGDIVAVEYTGYLT